MDILTIIFIVIIVFFMWLSVHQQNKARNKILAERREQRRKNLDALTRFWDEKK